METLNCIQTRRSKRVFLDKEVSEDLINKILNAGINAPSSVDCQPWHFIIVKDKEKLKKLAKLKERDNHKHILTAPISIITCVNMEKSPSRYLEDGVTATQNMLLAIHELGLGSVYLSACKPSKPELAQKVRDILDIPANIIPVTMIPIGYADDEALENKTLLNLKDITHYDDW